MRNILYILVLLLLLPYVSRAEDYIIGEGDGLDVSVWGVRDLNAIVRVRPDGKITIPGLGDVVASGLTPKELQSSLGEKLKDLVKNPIVTVSVREITNSKVYFFGGGVNSGVYDLNRKTTLLQLLCVISGSSSTGAGGGGPAGAIASAQVRSPDYKKAYLLRNGKKIKENFQNLFILGDVSEDVVVQPNDSIFIPQLLDRNVYVLGAVNTSRAIEYRDGMTVMDAILEAGGFNRFASPNDTVVFRKEQGKDVSLPILAKELIKNGDLSQNVRIKAGDYIIAKEGIF